MGHYASEMGEPKDPEYVEDEQYEPEQVIAEAADRIKIDLRLQSIHLALQCKELAVADEVVSISEKLYKWLLTGQNKALDPEKD
jgi:hypothetical protein